MKVIKKVGNSLLIGVTDGELAIFCQLIAEKIGNAYDSEDMDTSTVMVLFEYVKDIIPHALPKTRAYLEEIKAGLDDADFEEVEDDETEGTEAEGEEVESEETEAEQLEETLDEGTDQEIH